MRLLKFAAIWFAVVIVTSALFISMSTLFNRPNTAEKTGQAHFSVVWTGFRPEYSNQYPDYYICINNLKDDLLNMSVQLKIENYENVSLYFMIDSFTTPPEGWFVCPQHFGFIDIVDPIKVFTYENMSRTRPSSIAEGIRHESVEVAVKSYYDEAYTQFYSEANFTISFHFIDITSNVWTTLAYDNFDDGTAQGWYADTQWWQIYRSWPCSVSPHYWYWGMYRLYKTFNVIGDYTEAYFVAAMWDYPQNIQVNMNGTLCFQPETQSDTKTWHQIAFPMPLNSETTIEFGLIGGYDVRLDDVYILAK